MNATRFLLGIVGLVTTVPLCGRLMVRAQRIPGPETKIIGGQEANLGDWPWQGMFLQKSSPNRVSLVCGCSLIKSWWVLTAAHCTSGRAANNILVRFGVVSTMNPEPSGRDYDIDTIYQHTGYDTDTLENDISLLRTKTEVRMNAYIKPVPLPAQGDVVAVRTDCYITGWGSISTSEQIIPDNMMEAKVPIISTNTCAILYASETIFPTQLCAGYLEGGVDTCQGDSGGPLVCPSSDGTFVQQGITSYGRGCAQTLSPGVYTRVSEYAIWISNTTNGADRPHGNFNLLLHKLAFLTFIHLLFANF